MAKAVKGTLQEEYLQIVRDMDGDEQGRAAADSFLSTVLPDGMNNRTGWATNAYVIDADQMAVLEKAAQTMGSIMEKVMAKYQRDRAFRKLFELDPRIEELTLVPSGCHAAVPLSRLDMTFDRETGDFKISDIVTGGVDGMAACVGVAEAVRLTNAFREFESKHESVESIDPVQKCLMSIMHTYGKWANAEVGRNHPTHPSIAVVDVPDSKRAAETKVVIGRMRDYGCFARSTDFSQLHIESAGGTKQLVDNYGPVTCVWLRATADEAIACAGEGLDALMEATRRGLVCTVGGYRSWPCCTRSFLSLLRTSAECRQLLTWEERAFIDAHIPAIHIINPAIDISQFYDQERWVLRSADGSLFKGIIAGANMARAAWRNRLVKGIKRRDAVQGYIPDQPLEVATADGIEKRNVVLGAYVFESKLSGIRVSCASNPMALEEDMGVEMAALVVR